MGNASNILEDLSCRSLSAFPGRGYGRVIDLLETLASETRGLTGSDVSRRLGVPKSTVFLLLHHLLEREVVSIDPETRRYRIGPALVRMAFRITGSIALVKVARPHLQRLSQDTTEDAYLGIRQERRLIYVDKLEGSQSIRLDLPLGQPRYLHSTAVGKLLLAHGSAELLEALVAETALPAVTATTITDPDRLRDELARIRERGYSTTEGENVEGVYGFAAPVRDHTGAVIAGLHISSLKARALARREFLIERVCARAVELSRDLGWH